MSSASLIARDGKMRCILNRHSIYTPFSLQYTTKTFKKKKILTNMELDDKRPHQKPK